MGLNYLTDSNVVIDYLASKLPPLGTEFIDGLLPAISVISKIEILGWLGITSRQVEKLTPFINNAFVYPLDETIVSETIKIRQQFKIKTPDAIIAATAIIHRRTLLGCNNKDFKGIPGLILVDPYEIENT